MKKTIILSISTAIALLASNISDNSSLIDKDYQSEKINNYLSSISKINSENMIILNEKEVIFPYSKRKLRLFKLDDKKTHDGEIIALDEHGDVVDYQNLLKEEKAAKFNKLGVMNKALAKQVLKGGDIPVMLQLSIKENFIDKSKLMENKKQLNDLTSKEQIRVQTEAKNIFNNIKEELKVNYSIKEKISGPFIFTTLSSTAIERLSKDKRVLFIGLDKEKRIKDSTPTITQSLPTTKTNTVHSYGYTGDGVKIAVLETGQLSESSSCFNLIETQTTSGSTSSHMTNSLGIIGNRYNSGSCEGTWEGYAPDADIYLANDSDYQDAYDWAKSKNVNVITMSWHSPSEETNGDLASRDEYFDYQVTHYPYPSIFTSAGNQAGSDAFASGKGYNFVGVGDVVNDGDGNRCDDVMHTSSSWKNPISLFNEREIPEIVAPGSRHALLNGTFGHTSAATPVAASIATVLMSKNSSLKFWPEGIRAIMQVSANYQNADGANFSPSSDGRDGTGLLNTRYGYLTASKRETGTTAQYRAHDYGSMSSASFSGGYFNKTWKVKTGTTNSSIRVALTWNSKTDSTTSDSLVGDLDLKVYNSSGSLVASSTSWDNNNEFVEFTPASSGEYTIKIRGYSVPSDFSTYYSVAWTTHYDLCN